MFRPVYFYNVPEAKKISQGSGTLLIVPSLFRSFTIFLDLTSGQHTPTMSGSTANATTGVPFDSQVPTLSITSTGSTAAQTSAVADQTGTDRPLLSIGEWVGVACGVVGITVLVVLFHVVYRIRRRARVEKHGIFA